MTDIPEFLLINHNDLLLKVEKMIDDKMAEEAKKYDNFEVSMKIKSEIAVFFLMLLKSGKENIEKLKIGEVPDDDNDDDRFIHTIERWLVQVFIDYSKELTEFFKQYAYVIGAGKTIWDNIHDMDTEKINTAKLIFDKLATLDFLPYTWDMCADTIKMSIEIIDDFLSSDKNAGVIMEFIDKKTNIIINHDDIINDKLPPKIAEIPVTFEELDDISKSLNIKVEEKSKLIEKHDDITVGVLTKIIAKDKRDSINNIDKKYDEKIKRTVISLKKSKNIFDYISYEFYKSKDFSSSKTLTSAIAVTGVTVGVGVSVVAIISVIAMVIIMAIIIIVLLFVGVVICLIWIIIGLVLIKRDHKPYTWRNIIIYGMLGPIAPYV